MSFIFGKSLFQILCNSKSFTRHGQNQRSHSIFKKQKPIKEISPYIIVRANLEDQQEILDVMHDSYYTGEPTVVSLKIPPNPILDERALGAMSQGYTLVARCKYNGNIVGACINEATHPWDPDLDEKFACSVKSEDIRKLLMFYAHLMRAPNLWKCLDVKQVYEMSYLFVKRAHRKKGLAYKLLKESKSLGADAGFAVIRCDATSAHTSRICQAMGMQKVAEIPYCSYLDQNLEPIFKPPWPHESVRVYCDCAPQYNELKKKIKKKRSFFNKKQGKTL